MTILPVEITSQTYLEELLKEFTGSKTSSWNTRQFISSAGQPSPTWGGPRTFMGRTTYTRYERKKALIFKSEDDFNSGNHTARLLAVQPKGKGITTRGLITVAHLADPDPTVRHFYNWRGFSIKVPRISETAIIHLFEEGILSYYFEDHTLIPGTNIPNPNDTAYVCVR